MKGKHVVAVMLALLMALALALPASVGANQERFKGKVAYASFRSIDEGGACTLVSVDAVDSARPLNESGLKGARSAAHVWIAEYETCPSDEPVEDPVEGFEQPSAVFMGDVALKAEDFVVGKKLGSATLDAEIPVRPLAPPCEADACGQVMPEERTIDVNLKWAGTGKLQRINERHDGYRAKGSSRSGETTGSVYTSAIGDTDVVEEHVTPGDVSEYAEMLSISERFKTKSQPPMEPGIPMQGGPF